NTHLVHHRCLCISIQLPQLSPLAPASLHPFLSFNDPPPPHIYTLSLHDALPISQRLPPRDRATRGCCRPTAPGPAPGPRLWRRRSEEHTSELQSRSDLVCRLLLEKKKTDGVWFDEVIC